MRDHTDRITLSNEFHARPFASLRAPEQASYFAMLLGDTVWQEQWHYLTAVCDRYGVARPREDANHFTADLGTFRLKWERHTEFLSYTFFHQGICDRPFACPASTYFDQELLSTMPGQRIVATHVELIPADAPEITAEALNSLFVADTLCSSEPGQGAARIWTDYQIHEDGFGRILVRDIGLGHRQAGRLVQRLLEIDAYRLLAMMALPLAREIGPVITEIELQLTDLTHRIKQVRDLEGERALLDRITDMSARGEEQEAAAAYRFSAARAYEKLVAERIDELRERRVEGFQTIGEFMDRRLAPAMRTCASVSDRLDSLAERVTRAAELLRTRIDLELEAQNRDLLASMNRRAKLQLRLQETVEGLSIAAITYYLAGLISYLLDAAVSAGVPLNKALSLAMAIPLIAFAVWYALRRWRRRLQEMGATDPSAPKAG